MFAERAQSRNKEFRFRGKEPGRLENFSDACFALAITLLLISTSPPTSFEMVRRFVWEIIPFALCIIFIVLIWYEHFQFYYRYGLRTSKVIVLNSLFLVIVLFYVYPLKFLTKLLLIPISMLFGADEIRADVMSTIKGTDIAELMIIYGLGASATFFTFMLMYRAALAKSADLDLNEIEIFDTKASIRMNLLMALIPLVSVLMAIIFQDNPALSGIIPGFTYFLYTPVMWINGNRTEKQREKLLSQAADNDAKAELPEGHFSSSKAGEPI
jgi:uncharacterized membrane protein